MDVGSLIGALILGGLIFGVAILMPYAIMRNLKSGLTFREQLAEDLSALRLSRMLGFLGINKDEYLHKQKALDIKQHMQKCDTCDEKAQCDETFVGDQALTEVDLSFCANIEALEKIDKKQPSTN
jgi:hypothetical protein